MKLGTEGKVGVLVVEREVAELAAVEVVPIELVIPVDKDDTDEDVTLRLVELGLLEELRPLGELGPLESWLLVLWKVKLPLPALSLLLTGLVAFRLLDEVEVMVWDGRDGVRVDVDRMVELIVVDEILIEFVEGDGVKLVVVMEEPDRERPVSDVSIGGGLVQFPTTDPVMLKL